MKTFFNPKMVARADSYSLSPLKPRLLVEWAQLRHRDEHTDFEPATREQIALAHDRAYVDGVLDLRIANGFGTKTQEVADSLSYTVGSMIAAVRHVLQQKEYPEFGRCACSPTSGFHHAGYNYGGGFCTFNGLMVALLVAKEEGLIKTATILDGDMHWGDGTKDIIDKLGLDWITHWTGPRGYRGEYLRSFGEAVRCAKDTDIVLYQAGADIHVDDPLGGMISTGEMKWRDIIVCHHLRMVPLVWNLAGGYQYDKTAGTLEGRMEPIMKLHKQSYNIFRGLD